MTNNLSSSKRPTSIRQADPSAGKSPTPVGNDSVARRSHGSYARQLAANGPAAPATEVEAKRTAAVILEVLAGLRTPAGAASASGVGLPRYYAWEQRAVQGLVAARAPRPRGRVTSPDRRRAALERELATARRELARHQALARTSQRALGLPAVADPRPPSRLARKAKGSGPEAATDAQRRRRHRPAVRALRAARLLRDADSSGGDSPIAVQSGQGPPGAGTQTAAGTSGAISAGESNHPADPRAEMT
jgi:hypothetical protein